MSQPAVEVECAALSDPGKVRDNNEDHYFVARFERAMRTLLTNLTAGQLPESSADAGYAMLVADGIGGQAAGEIASGMAVRLLVELVLETPDWILNFDGERAREVLSRMEQRFRRVADAFVKRGRAEPALAGMGTTMTIALSAGAEALITHVGDSRAYLFREGKLHRLTRDQTVAQMLADAGEITPEQVETHPSRHVLTGAITTHEGEIPVELRHVHLQDGDQLLLCSDGLTDMATDEAIGRALERARSAEKACRALVDLALDGGGKDNVTVVLVRYRIEE